MPESGRRVVLLARPGPARDRLRAALTEAAAELVLEADPTRVTPEELGDAQPEVVIVALDSATEAALDRLDAVLCQPSIDVMYEEADVAANRNGWDAARWVRHLSAKLNRHTDVLPPGASAAAAPLPEVQPQTEAAPAAVEEPGIELPAFAFEDAGLAGLDTPPAHPLSDDFSPGVEPGSYGAFDPVAAEIGEFEATADQVITFDSSLRDDFVVEPSHLSTPSVDMGLPSLDPTLAEGLPALDLVFESELELPADVLSPAAVDTPRFQDFSLDDLPAEPRGPVADDDAVLSLDFDITPPDAAPAPAAPEKAAPFAGLSSGHVLELVNDDAPTPAASVGGTSRQTNLADLERRIASLELVEDTPAAPRGGAVLLVAGIGGPDAVRQVLGALPEGFSRPVIVQQRLDGGRYDRLVSQLERATRLPVDLAEPGTELRPGVVYVLPADVGISAGSQALTFDDSGRTYDALLPADSAVLLLSGSDPAIVDRLVSPEWSDGLVVGQSTDGCYDAAASVALAAHGRPTAPPAELAQRLVERWSAA
ncbi:chemotaxis protein CheB [Lysobacter korlensis]|uniref:protein-glutamate methylesterase n=1 Tax=Lysobacter korlensis TaxID=553636 RepID=A0ABV6RJK6_9GAMM